MRVIVFDAGAPMVTALQCLSWEEHQDCAVLIKGKSHVELSVPCPVDGCITEALKAIRSDACVEKHLLFHFGSAFRLLQIGMPFGFVDRVSSCVFEGFSPGNSVFFSFRYFEKIQQERILEWT